MLIDTTTIGQAIQSVALAMPPGKGVGERTLDVLVAGAVLPPNPTELLESHAITPCLSGPGLLRRPRGDRYPPLTAVSDAFPLLNRVDGVIIAGWVGRSRRDAAEQLPQTLASSGAPLLGIVVNGYTSKTFTMYAATDRNQIPSTRTSNGAVVSDELTPNGQHIEDSAIASSALSPTARIYTRSLPWRQLPLQLLYIADRCCRLRRQDKEADALAPAALHVSH